MKIHGWSQISLSQVGQEIMIKSVLQAIPYTSCLIFFYHGFWFSICIHLLLDFGGTLPGIGPYIGLVGISYVN